MEVTPRSLEVKTVLGASTEPAANPTAMSRSCRDAGMLPVINEKRPPGGAHGRPRRADHSALGVRPQNYFYAGFAAGLPDRASKSPIVGEGENVVELDGGRPPRSGSSELHLEQDAGKYLHHQSPTMSYVDLEPLRRRADGDRVEPDIRDAEEAKAYVTKAVLDPALSRYLRRRHGEGLVARRCERFRA